ncbi:coiled-coil domain-containing protein 112 [Megalops cyprinoides]|uniref:coiled-coil domain-containing protein 112 n=1 Tax=Megalops cyprinoides TaxID=118141 RepID=UPI0018654E89|nr:coiled-coil domain-containing protein 112 [Megalops cyprinoides]
MAALATTASAETLPENEDDFRIATHHQNLNRREKAAQTKKSEFLRNVEKLRKQVDKLEKEKALSNQSKNFFRDDSGTLEEFDNRLKDDRKTDLMKLQQQLRKLNNGVNRFQRQLMDVKPTPELIEKLRDIMTEVENSISTFKEDQRQSFEELLKEEKTYWQEICAFEKKIGMWSSAAAVSAVPKAPPAPLAKAGLAGAPDGELPPEVTELERFLQRTGGRQGGWDQYDHQSFLKVWTKHGGRPAHRKEALLHLPGKTEEEVIQHEDWYQTLLLLEEKKREAIQRWKTERQQKKEVELRQQEEKEDMARQEEAWLVEAQQRREEEERREAEAQLQVWKAQRRLQVAQEKQRRLQVEVLERKRAKEKRRQQLEVKLVVEARVRERKQQEQFLLLERELFEQEEIRERARSAARQIRHFQERDLYKLETKLQEKQTKEEEEEEKQKRLAKLKEKVSVEVHRDPTRVWKPTKGWEERTKQIGPTGGGPVLQMFHRAVPSWRQGL